MAIIIFPTFFLNVVLVCDGGHHCVKSFLFNVTFLFFSLILLDDTKGTLSLRRGPTIVSFFNSFSAGDRLAVVVFLLVNALVAYVMRDSTTIVTVAVLLYSANILPVCLNVTLIVNRGVKAATATGLTTLNTGTRTHHTTLTRLMFGIFNIV